MSTLERAIAIAAEAHAGQLDKAGAPYILHPLRMMLKMRTREEQIVTVLHDVVEDSAWTLEQLRAEGFAPEILAAVDAMTKRPGEEYEAFVLRAGSNLLARPVKFADLADNMEQVRLANPTDPDPPQLEKYRNAWRLLETM